MGETVKDLKDQKLLDLLNSLKHDWDLLFTPATSSLVITNVKKEHKKNSEYFLLQLSKDEWFLSKIKDQKHQTMSYEFNKHILLINNQIAGKSFLESFLKEIFKIIDQKDHGLAEVYEQLQAQKEH